jgi:hypothetical protein
MGTGMTIFVIKFYQLEQHSTKMVIHGDRTRNETNMGESSLIWRRPNQRVQPDEFNKRLQMGGRNLSEGVKKSEFQKNRDST